jgi:hypothetical protein
MALEPTNLRVIAIPATEGARDIGISDPRHYWLAKRHTDAVEKHARNQEAMRRLAAVLDDKTYDDDGDMFLFDADDFHVVDLVARKGGVCAALGIPMAAKAAA